MVLLLLAEFVLDSPVPAGSLVLVEVGRPVEVDEVFEDVMTAALSGKTRTPSVGSEADGLTVHADEPLDEVGQAIASRASSGEIQVVCVPSGLRVAHRDLRFLKSGTMGTAVGDKAVGG